MVPHCSPPIREPPQSGRIQTRRVLNREMTTSTRGSSYKLSGFNELLSWCTIAFRENLPQTKVCRLCGVVPSMINLLPCRHGVCDFCKTLALKGTSKCPIDGEKFKEADVGKLECSLGDLTEREVYCPNNGRNRTNCTFSGKLLYLSKHLSEECMHAQVQCPQCGEGFTRRSITAHHSRCEGMNSRSASTSMPGRPSPYQRPSDYQWNAPEGRRAPGFETMEQDNGSPCEVEDHFSQPEYAGPSAAQHPPPMGPERGADNTCNTNHETRFVECVKGVVYRIPLMCGRHYVGQTSACLNERLRQHRGSLGTGRGNLAHHCSQCKGCHPLFHLTAVLENSQNELERLRMEAEYINEDRETCISDYASWQLRGNH